MPFALDRPPARTRARFDTREPTRQAVLFSGLGCLPNQSSLFLTDGPQETDHDDLDDSSRSGAILPGRATERQRDDQESRTTFRVPDRFYFQVQRPDLCGNLPDAADASEARDEPLRDPLKPDFCRNCGEPIGDDRTELPGTDRFYCPNCAETADLDLTN